MRGLFFGIILFSLFAILFASQTLYNSHQETNKTFDIYNFTENNLVWNYTLEEDTIRNNLSEMMGLDYGEIQSKRIRNLIHKFVDFFGYSLFEVSKWVIEFGYTHPGYDFGFFMNFVKYWLFAMIIIAIFPILIPLLALIYIVIIKLNKIFKYAKVKLWQRKKKL
jgi:hypothetical protein